MNLAERQAEMRHRWQSARVGKPHPHIGHPSLGGYAHKLSAFLKAPKTDRPPYESAERRLITHMCHFCLTGKHGSCANPDCPCPCGDTEFLYQDET